MTRGFARCLAPTLTSFSPTPQLLESQSPSLVSFRQRSAHGSLTGGDSISIRWRLLQDRLFIGEVIIKSLPGNIQVICDLTKVGLVYLGADLHFYLVAA